MNSKTKRSTIVYLLVALCVAFTSFCFINLQTNTALADSAVSTEEQLINALQENGTVQLSQDVTLNAMITIP